jgi:class 3 adenylate cyclase/pimeloyl-ACP methyl ester carboxylesterase
MGVMEPRIQYAKTKDGVSIAYWTMGEGMPLVVMPWIPSHAQLLWQLPELRRMYEGFAEGRKLISYDGRGTGLSDRDVSDFSLDAHVLDLEAVVEHLELKRFALFAVTQTGTAAIAYAAHHPERVTRLALGASVARVADASGTPGYRAMRTLQDSDWELYTETIGHYLYGLDEAEQARRYAAYFRESISQQATLAMRGHIDKFDVSSVLPQVKSPTLILHPRQTPLMPVDAVRRVASAIPNAQLVLVEGRTLISETAVEAMLVAINEFLGEGEEARGAPEPLAKEDVHTILFTDVEGSTALTQRLGDAKARQVLRDHEHIVRDSLKAHGGSEVKTMGDGFMASFSSATRALECAIAMQRAFAQHSETAEEPIRVRIGLNAGEPIAEEEDLFGTAVIRAARIAAMAEGGEILVANVVRELAEGKGFLFSDRGNVALRGFDDPVRLFDVRWQGED